MSSLLFIGNADVDHALVAAAAGQIAGGSTGTDKASAAATAAAVVSRISSGSAGGTRTAYAAHDAQSAAAVFVEALTPAELTDVGRAIIAEREEAAAKAAARAAAAKASGVYGLNTTLAMWQSWTAEQRAEHMRFLSTL